jgi:5-methylcytosine-specific restriction endonuclease McrA
MDFSLHNPPLSAAEGVHTPSRLIRLPRVILLTYFDRLPCKELKLTRSNVYDRDKSTCQYCGKGFPREELNLDHVIPRDRGGKTTWENIVCSCIPCNTRKANRLPHPQACASKMAPCYFNDSGRSAPRNVERLLGRGLLERRVGGLRSLGEPAGG